VVLVVLVAFASVVRGNILEETLVDVEMFVF